MDLKEFTIKALTDIVEAVDNVKKIAIRDIYLSDSKNNRTIEFDIAVSVENTDTKGAKAGIKVLQFVQGSGDVLREVKNSTVSRILFGVYVETSTRAELAKHRNDSDD